MRLNGNNLTGPRRAFTLIEMVLAIGMAALVLLVVNSVLFTAIHLRDSTSTAVDAAAPIDQATDFLRRDLACVVTPTNGTSKYLSGSFRVGSVTSVGSPVPVNVEMVTATGALSDAEPWGDLQRVTYELKSPATRSANNANDGFNLVRSVTRNLLAVATPDVTDQVLLTGVRSFKLACYDGTQWEDTWDTSNPTATFTNLPLAVRVDIQLVNASPTAPIEMVVPIDSVTRTNMVLATTTGG